MTRVCGFSRAVGVAAALVLTVATASSPVLATVMMEVGLEDMTADSDAIVVGQVIHTAVQMVLRDGSLEPHSVTRIRVRDWLFGGEAAEITIRELGGETRQLGGMWISGTPRYEVGEEVLVFLRRDPSDPAAYRTYAMAQGKFVIRRGAPGVPAWAVRDLEGVAFAGFADGQTQVEHAEAGPTMHLDGLIAQIRGTLSQLAGRAQ